MSTLAQDVVDYLRGERASMTVERLAYSINREAMHNPQWPTASYAAWRLAIDEAVKAGELTLKGNVVCLASKAIEAKPEQLKLF